MWPANSAMAVDLQVSKSDLQNTRIVATESGPVLGIGSWAASELVREAAGPSAAEQAASPANSVAIRFGFGSTRVVVRAETASGLVEGARSAPLVLLHVRTDGATNSAAESRIARERAAAVRDFLVGAGVDPARMRATYQPSGDHAADNSSPASQGTNRRVEIEVYRALPVATGSSAAATS